MDKQKIYLKLRKCIDTITGIPAYSAESRLSSDLGLDSLDRLSLEMAIREEFDDYFYDEIDLQGEDKDISVSELVNLIAEALDYDVIR